jgi:hypothetical protein
MGKEGVVLIGAGAVAWAIASGAGCSSTSVPASPSAPDASTPEASLPSEASAPDFGAPSTTYPAYPVPTLPQIQRGPGSTLTDITVVPVVYAGDPGAADVPAFLAKYAASAEWNASVGEYGGKTMTVGATVTLSEAAPTTMGAKDFVSFLQAKLDGTHPEWGPTDNATFQRTIYLLIYPSGTTLSDVPGRSTCVDFFGFHSAVAPRLPDGGLPPPGANPVPIVFAAAARCAATGYTDAQTLSAMISHELIEATLSPTGPGYGQVDTPHQPWAVGMHGSEAADLCNVQGSYWEPPDVGFTIARAWSNAAAAAGHDPCVPGPAGEAYFGSFIAPSDQFPIAGAPGAPMMGGVSVPVGQTRTVDVFLFSDRAVTGPWDVHAVEVSMSPSNPPALSLSLDRTSGVNGEKVHLTITANKSVTQGLTAVMLSSKLGTRETLWFTPISVR